MKYDNLTQEEKLAARKELDMHNSAAKYQRGAMSRFTKAYDASFVCGFDLPEQILVDHIDEPLEETFHELKSVLVMREDFSQGIEMPHYGHVRPGSYYFNSNLTLNLYVMSDLSRN